MKPNVYLFCWTYLTSKKKVYVHFVARIHKGCLGIFETTVVAFTHQLLLKFVQTIFRDEYVNVSGGSQIPCVAD